jgi:hypothetical protein
MTLRLTIAPEKLRRLRRIWWRGWFRRQHVFFRPSDGRWVVFPWGEHREVGGMTSREYAEELLADYDEDPIRLGTMVDDSPVVEIGPAFPGHRAVALADGRRLVIPEPP